MAPADKAEGAPAGDGSEAPRLVLGTAGHIDHGKTSLIHALTGTDTDRLPEEKDRGITIELGFAALDLPNGVRVSVVDVPGHERLVRTMVSGASGIDCVLLVVAADEGVMPQTREHVAICELLGLDRGVVALTKKDLADEEMCELAAEEVSELVADTALRDAPIVAVSSTTGDGLDALREALADVLDAARTRTSRTGPPRLGVDRSFAMRGFGTVVTGTLVGRGLRVGDTAELLPSGVRGKIRGLQSHGEKADRVLPGARCAVNLQGIEVAEAERGQVLTAPDAMSPTSTADLRLFWLAGAPAGQESVAVEFLTGTTERRAHVAPIGAEALVPGAWNFARVHIEGSPVAVLPGDRFIVRGFARLAGGGGTLGGGIILDAAPPRRRRSDPELVRSVEVLASGDLPARVHEHVARRGLAGIAGDALSHELGQDADALNAELQALVEAGRIHAAGGRRWVADNVVSRLQASLRKAVGAFHSAEPLRPGIPRATLRASLPDNVASETRELALSRLEAAGEIVSHGDLVALADFAPKLDADSQALIEQIRELALGAGLEPPSLRDWEEKLATAPERVRDLLAYLERAGDLVRAPGDLWFAADAVATLRAKVLAHLEQHGELGTKDYKEIIGTSRRTAVPLMELFDEQHLTHRKGEVRILRKSSGA